MNISQAITATIFLNDIRKNKKTWQEALIEDFNNWLKPENYQGFCLQYKFSYLRTKTTKKYVEIVAKGCYNYTSTKLVSSLRNKLQLFKVKSKTMTGGKVKITFFSKRMLY